MKEKVLKFFKSVWTYVLAAAGILLLLYLDKSTKGKGAVSATAVTKLKVKAEAAVENAKQSFAEGKAHGEAATAHRLDAENALKKSTELFDEDSESEQEAIDNFISNDQRDR